MILRDNEQYWDVAHLSLPYSLYCPVVDKEQHASLAYSNCVNCDDRLIHCNGLQLSTAATLTAASWMSMGNTSYGDDFMTAPVFKSICVFCVCENILTPTRLDYITFDKNRFVK